MRAVRIVRALLVAFVLAQTPARADTNPLEQAAQAPETVTLRFAWKPGMTARVTSTRARTRVTDERSHSSATSRYTLVVRPDGDGLRIHFADPSFELGGDLGPLPDSAQAQIVAQVADLVPDYRVTPGGEFVGIHDLPAFQKGLRALLAGMFPEDASGAKQALEQIQSLLSSEVFLNGRAAEQWNAVVGAWVGAELEVGAEYTHSMREPVAVFPGEQILMHYTFSARRLLPCTRAGVERDCAELEMRSRADPDDSKRMIESFLSKLAGAGPPPAVFREIDIENVIRVVSEPDGLMPHTYRLTRTLRGAVAADGKVQGFEQVDSTDVAYAYGK